MIRPFGDSGGCIALYDENTSQMVICLHMRLRSITPALTGSKKAVEELNSYRERITIDLADPSSSPLGKIRRLSPPLETDPVMSLEKSALFPLASALPF